MLPFVHSLMGNHVGLVICILRKSDLSSYLDHSVQNCAVTLKMNAKESASVRIELFRGQDERNGK